MFHMSVAAMRQMGIGGGVVRRAFRSGTRYLMAGTKITEDEILRMPRASAQALIDSGYIMVWPKGEAAPAAVVGKRYAIHVGGGSYDVIEGRKLNDAPLSKEDARALASDKPPN